jgi:hypothetical protein
VQLADATIARLRPLDLDGLILYDIDDEASRNPAERAFPFSPTLDPADYLANCAVRPADMARRTGPGARHVGSRWSKAHGMTSLAQAQALRREANPELSVGGVAIPERHSRREDEHLRLLAKQDEGCRFFVTQVVYAVNAAKNLVSDRRPGPAPTIASTASGVGA